MQLRDYQTDGINQVRSLMRRGIRCVLRQCPTGAGKTVEISYITESAQQIGKRILILAHRTELILQASEELNEMGISHGIIQAGISSRLSRQVQIGSVQTVVKRLDQIGDFDLIIIDEAHHTPAGNYQKILEAFPNAKVIGFTATPKRTDGKGLDSCFDKLVLGPSIRDLIDLGCLKEPKVFAPNIIDTSGLHSRFGDFKKDELEEISDKPTITGCAITAYRQYGNAWPAIAFCVSVAHAEHVAEAFRDAGFRAEKIDGTTDHATRKRQLRDLAEGRIHVLTSCDLISEGVNIPVVSVGIMLRPTQSLGLWMQQAGRCLRPSPGYPHAIILDHAGNSFRHGHPASDRDWSLTGESKSNKKKPEVSVRQCMSCYAVHPANLRQCPECGNKYTTVDRDSELALIQKEGELAEMSEEQVKLLRRREVGRARSLDDLLRIEKERGYKPGWAQHVYNGKRQRSAV